MTDAVAALGVDALITGTLILLVTLVTSVACWNQLQKILPNATIP